LAGSFTIEDIILSQDRRGLSALRGYLPADYCADAARLILDSRKNGRAEALITTGFYILSAEAAETDGPPGAVALAKALHKLGFEVAYVTDKYAAPLFAPDIAGPESVIEFPITDSEKSKDFAQNLLNDIKPAVIISTERCGIALSGKYLNMVCRDITEFTAKIDYLFQSYERTIGIGDGGNEIGMGNLAHEIPKYKNLTPEPAITRVNKLIVASVSNWGAYGLIAAISILVKQNLLPDTEWEKEIIKEIVRRGAVDGVSGLNKLSVDGFDLEQNAWTLAELNRFVGARINKNNHY
jgi:hypothetical protein